MSSFCWSSSSCLLVLLVFIGCLTDQHSERYRHYPSVSPNLTSSTPLFFKQSLLKQSSIQSSIFKHPSLFSSIPTRPPSPNLPSPISIHPPRPGIPQHRTLIPIIIHPIRTHALTRAPTPNRVVACAEGAGASGRGCHPEVLLRVLRGAEGDEEAGGSPVAEKVSR